MLGHLADGRRHASSMQGSIDGTTLCGALLSTQVGDYLREGGEGSYMKSDVP